MTFLVVILLAFIKIYSWQKDLTQLSSYEDSPFELKEYVNLLEQILELPIKIVSVGPDRKQTLFR